MFDANKIILGLESIIRGPMNRSVSRKLYQQLSAMENLKKNIFKRSHVLANAFGYAIYPLNTFRQVNPLFDDSESLYFAVRESIRVMKDVLFDVDPCLERRTDLVSLIDIMFHIHYLDFENKGINVERAVAVEDPVSVCINAGEFQSKIMFDLISKALKYGESKTRYFIEDQNDKYLISIWSNYKGDQIPRFELADARKVIEKYNGQIWAETSRDWIDFKFTLPKPKYIDV